MTATLRRIGVFGGAFDPPHLGHVALVQAAIGQLALDEVRLVPTGHAWHKQATLSPAKHRLAMAELAFGGIAKLVVDARETERPGPSYTVDTLSELQHEQPGAQLFLLLGADQAATLNTWHRLADIARLASLWVAPRDADSPNCGAAATVPVPLGALEMAPQLVASRQIRTRLAQGLSVAELVPAGVARYIDQHSLYRNH